MSELFNSKRLELVKDLAVPVVIGVSNVNDIFRRNVDDLKGVFKDYLGEENYSIN